MSSSLKLIFGHDTTHLQQLWFSPIEYGTWHKDNRLTPDKWLFYLTFWGRERERETEYNLTQNVELKCKLHRICFDIQTINETNSCLVHTYSSNDNWTPLVNLEYIEIDGSRTKEETNEEMPKLCEAKTMVSHLIDYIVVCVCYEKGLKLKRNVAHFTQVSVSFFWLFFLLSILIRLNFLVKLLPAWPGVFCLSSSSSVFIGKKKLFLSQRILSK